MVFTKWADTRRWKISYFVLAKIFQLEEQGHFVSLNTDKHNKGLILVGIHTSEYSNIEVKRSTATL